MRMDYKIPHHHHQEEDDLEFDEQQCKPKPQLVEKPPSIEESRKPQISDYRVLEEIGSGSFGLVKLVEKDGFKYALKELSKDQVISVRYFSINLLQLGKTESVFRERDFLQMVKHPGFPKIYQTFQVRLILSKYLG